MRPRLQLLDEALIDRIVNEALDLLGTLGLNVQNENATRLLLDNGASPQWYPLTTIPGFENADLIMRVEARYTDARPPSFAIGVLQNPIIGEELDVYVASDGPLNGGTLSGRFEVDDHSTVLDFGAGAAVADGGGELSQVPIHPDHL